MNNETDELNIKGYREALHLAQKHYENFPVVSWLIPSELKNDVAIIYWFARTADDLSDEGNLSSSERLEKLEEFGKRLEKLLTNEPANNLEAALKNTISTKNLNPEHFHNLINAFKQDVIKNRYRNFDEVLNYCSNSANPVGRILLELFRIRDDKANFYSDKICTALQITNFIQDTKVDFEKGRIYYPLEDMEHFSVDEKVFEMRRNNLNFKKLIEFSVNRVQQYFDEGKPILKFLSGKFKYEIVWTIKGGEEILNKIRGADFDVLSDRPKLTKVDFFKIFIKSLLQN
jgi:squalene synthase HpnC